MSGAFLFFSFLSERGIACAMGCFSKNIRRPACAIQAQAQMQCVPALYADHAAYSGAGAQSNNTQPRIPRRSPPALSRVSIWIPAPCARAPTHPIDGDLLQSAACATCAARCGDRSAEGRAWGALSFPWARGRDGGTLGAPRSVICGVRRCWGCGKRQWRGRVPAGSVNGSVRRLQRHGGRGSGGEVYAP